MMNDEFHRFRADLAPFSRLEEEQILAWILKYKAFSLLRTDTIWMRMEKLEVFQGRPWKSLKEHFMDYIVPNLCQFNISLREKLKIEAYMNDSDVRNTLEDTDIEGESDNVEVEFKIKRFTKEMISKDVASSSDENIYVPGRSRGKSKTTKYSKVPAEEFFNPSDTSASIVERYQSSLSGASDEDDDHDHGNSDGVGNHDLSNLRSSTSFECSKSPDHSMDSDTTGFGASSSKVHASNVGPGPGHVTKRSQEFGSTAPASTSSRERPADDGARAAAGSGILPVVANSLDEPETTGSDNNEDMDVSFESLSTEVIAQNVLPPVAINEELDFQEVPNNAQEDISDVEDVLDSQVEDVPIENILDVQNEEVPAPAGPVAPRRSTRTRRPPDRLLVDFRAGKIYKSER